MITTANYHKAIQGIGAQNLPQAMKKSHELINTITENGANWQRYNSDKEVKRFIDLYLEKLNQYAQANKLKAEHSNEALRFIKLFKELNGKVITEKQMRSLLNELQKAISEKRIRKNSPYAKEIRYIQQKLIEGCNSINGKAKILIEKKALKKLSSVTEKEGLGVLSTIASAAVFAATSKVVDKMLSGVMTIEDVKNSTFDLIGLEGEWLKLIGNACKPTHFFVHGSGGSGKSSFVLLFSQYLASLGYKILYVAGEQFGTPTFQQLINRLSIQASDNFRIVADLNRLSPADFDFIILDSKDSVGIKLPAFRELKKQYPKQSFIILSQATKSGNFTGNETWRNEVDVMLLAENGTIRSGHDKNRWGGAGEMKVF